MQQRGQPDDCRWDEAKIDPEAQPFALAGEVEELRARLHRVEAFLNKLPPSLQSSFEELGAKSLGPLASREWTPAEREVSPALLAAVIDKRGSIKDEAPADSLGVLDNFIFELASKPTGVAAAETDPELTAWRTSILAPRVVYSSPATGAVLGLDLCFSQAELDQCIKQVYDRVYSLLPTPEKMLRAIDRVSPSGTRIGNLPFTTYSRTQFFYRVHWVFSLLHRETFLAEFDRFQEMLRAGRRYSVDPAWLAILFNVSHFSLGFLQYVCSADEAYTGPLARMRRARHRAGRRVAQHRCDLCGSRNAAACCGGADVPPLGPGRQRAVPDYPVRAPCLTAFAARLC